ncbi:MAG: hypothetical protein PWR07_638 [Bacillota bacterium]|nr:hypothetical protein [Bacillota bacterium]
MIARGVSKSGHLSDGPDFGEARPAWGAVPESNTGNLSQKSGAFLHSHLAAGQRRALLAATSVFLMSIAMVIGPTPPGTGVM